LVFDPDSLSSNLNNEGLLQYFYNAENPVILGRILPEKEPYCFASFLIQIKIPPEYPFKQPEAIILDPIYHPSVMDDGSHCCCWRSDGESWKPTTTIIEFIKVIIHTIDDPNFGHPCNEEIANEYRNNYEKFYETALQYTLKYGRPRH
jgi:ubiquitin-protein ligase